MHMQDDDDDSGDFGAEEWERYEALHEDVDKQVGRDNLERERFMYTAVFVLRVEK